MRKRIYIAHPISKGPLVENLNRATEAFHQLVKAGYAPFCPGWSAYAKPAWEEHKYNEHSDCCEPTGYVLCEATAGGHSSMTHDEWLEVDLAWVAVADGVLRLLGESVGADRETAFALQNGIPLFHSIDELNAYFQKD